MRVGGFTTWDFCITTGRQLLLPACIISGWGGVDEFWARSLSGIVHRLIALTAFIITRRKKSRSFARTRMSSVIFAYTFEFLLVLDDSFLSARTWIHITMDW